ncbi:MAG: ribosome maturation factor RimM [Gammaproteobacteria bacterium]|nr:MAG: ribosome maturation factor RimM [Gammaproteobacteria bacterium]
MNKPPNRQKQLNKHKISTNYVAIGKVGSTYGIRGWLKIHSYTEFGASILDYSTWFLSSDQENWDAIQVEEGQLHGKGMIVKLAGINSPETARLLTGKLIAIPRSQLPKLKENEYYWSDLEGLTVIDQHGEILGKVIYLMETGSNDVLVVKGEKEHAIPYLPGRVILEVNLEKQEIHVNWELI